MIRGISFTTKQPIGDILQEILVTIDASKYNWHVVQSQTEAMDSSFENEIFEQDHYSGNELLNCDFHNSCIVFLKIEAYDGESHFENLLTYANFQQSNCQMLLLVYDCENAEIYAKNPSSIQAIETLLQKHQCFHYEIITDKTDTRVKLDIV